jgi:uncharacterized cupredoxin-like copper-binding protein
MKIVLSTIIAVATSLSVALAQGPAQRAADVVEDTAETAKNVGHSIAKGTKKAVNTVADALTPDPDARSVDVTLSDSRIDMPTSLKPGKTAFIVNNAGKKKHNFEVKGNGSDQKFLVDLTPKQTKVLHVNLKRGSYTVYSPVRGKEKGGLETSLTVR